MSLASIQRAVLQALAIIGRETTIIRVSAVSDEDAGTVTKTKTEITARTYFDNFNRSNTPEGFAVQAEDALVISDTEILKQDKVVRADGSTWNVIAVNPVEYEDGTAAWFVQARR